MRVQKCAECYRTEIFRPPQYFIIEFHCNCANRLEVRFSVPFFSRVHNQQMEAIVDLIRCWSSHKPNMIQLTFHRWRRSGSTASQIFHIQCLCMTTHAINVRSYGKNVDKHVPPIDLTLQQSQDARLWWDGRARVLGCGGLMGKTGYQAVMREWERQVTRLWWENGRDRIPGSDERMGETGY